MTALQLRAEIPGWVIIPWHDGNVTALRGDVQFGPHGIAVMCCHPADARYRDTLAGILARARKRGNTRE